MISISIPGFKKETFQIKHLLLDFNGTLAIDGKLIEGVKEKLQVLSNKLQIHVLTGNTFGTAQEELEDVPCKLFLLPKVNQSAEKEKYVESLENDSFIGIGNGRNDQKMLRSSAIGIIVIQKEGAAFQTLLEADIISENILDALDLLNNTLRLKATLRD